LTNSVLLINHEIDSAYWKEWELFRLPGGIAGFLLIHFPLLFLILYGLILVPRHSFFRSKGAYAGISLDGSVVKVNGDWNRAYYGKDVRPVDILVKKDVSNPKSAKLREALFKAAQATNWISHLYKKRSAFNSISHSLVRIPSDLLLDPLAFLQHCSLATLLAPLCCRRICHFRANSKRQAVASHINFLAHFTLPTLVYLEIAPERANDTFSTLTASSKPQSFSYSEGSLMVRKPTYEEFEQRVRELEKEPLSSDVPSGKC
jgi:hypothetical protein